MAKEKTVSASDAILAMMREINPHAVYLSSQVITEDDWIDTGSMVLNALISGSLYRGIPKGKVTQFCGPSQTFKSGFMLQILKNAQDRGMTVVVFDSEAAITREGAIAFGLDPEKLIYVRAKTIEGTKNDIYNFLEKIGEAGKNGEVVIAIDSLATMLAELEIKRAKKDSDSGDMGSLAKSLKVFLRMLINMAAETNTAVIMTNWVYDNPTEMYPSLEKHLHGGKAAVYLPTITVQLSRTLIKDDKNTAVDTDLAASQKNYSGVEIHALTVKNRLIKQYLEGKMWLSFSKGLDKYYGLLDLMRGMGVLELKGSIYYDWEGNKLGHAKKWRKDIDLWEKSLLPELEPRIKREWSYGNKAGERDVQEDYDDSDEDESEEEEITPKLTGLDKLKKMKKKVSSKLDELEESDHILDSIDLYNGG